MIPRDYGLCGAHHAPAPCPMCREAQRDREARAATARDRLALAVAELNEWWRESEGGDYYPPSERIATKYDVDVWTLRDVWSRPFLAAYRERDRTRS